MSKPLWMAESHPPKFLALDISVNTLFDKNAFKRCKCHCSSISAFLTRSSCSKIETVLSVDRRNISLTPIKAVVVLDYASQGRNRGFTSSKRKKGINCFVWRNVGWQVNQNFNLCSGIVFNSLNLNLSFIVGLKIESISDEVVVLNGIWRITKVFLSSWATLARTRILPPRNPSLYCPTSITPPVGKSGYNSNRFPFRCLIDASISSIKLCGKILVDSPTAIPSPPCASSNGNFTWRWIGSFLRPSYDNCHCVTLGL